MNWNDLNVFLTIADTGSLVDAAKKLGQNHSTIFRRLNALEENLKIRLFDRLKSGYQLTPIGERALVLARNAESAIMDIEVELAGHDMRPSGNVRVTTPPNIGRTILPHAVSALRNSHPQIHVEIVVGDTDHDLSRREADIALRATSKPPEHLVGKRVAEKLRWWLCGPGDTPKHQQPQSLDDLADFPLISADDSLKRIEAFQWLEKHYHDAIVARASDLTTMAALAKAGIGYALLPPDQIEEGLQRYFPLPNIIAELWLLTHPDLRNIQRVKVVWEAIASAIKTHYPIFEETHEGTDHGF